MKKSLLLSIAILSSTFFSTHLFSTDTLVDYNEQKVSSCSTQPNNQTQQRKQVCDYTILHNKNVNHTLDDINNKWLTFAKQGDKHEADKLRKQHQIDATQIKDKKGNNALHLACLHSGNVAMVTWLLDRCKIPIEKKGFLGKTPFLCALEKGQLSIAKLLKQRGANLNAKDKCGNNPLHYACFHSENIAMVTWLLDVCKIPIETKGQYQMTPFLCAAHQGQLSIAKLLRQRGADINVKDKNKNNALHYACLFSESIAMTTWLLDECKIPLETKGQYQKTPFLCAASKGQLAIAKLLKQRGANINQKNIYESNALHLSCFFSGNIAMTD